MTKAQVNQILVATVATVAAGLVLDYIRSKKPQVAPPVAEDSSFLGWF